MIRVKVLPAIEEHVTATAASKQRDECMPTINAAAAVGSCNNPQASCTQRTAHASHNDLTLIPPPKTPDEDQLIDFTLMMNAPPPGFSDDGSSTDSHQEELLPPTSVMDLPTPIREHMDAYVHSEEDLGGQLAAIDALMLKDAMLANLADKDGVESETDSGNETISSENVEMSGAGWPESLPAHPPEFPITEPPPKPNINLQDIDAFIASVTVPPPPSDVKTPEDMDFPPPPPSLLEDVDKTPTEAVNVTESFPPPPDVVAHTQEFSRKIASLDHSSAEVGPVQDNVSLEEEYASLIIPPPPSNSVTDALRSIPIVPPVDVKTPSPPESGSVVLRENKRSSLTVNEKETAEKKRQSLIDLEEKGPSVAALAKTLQQQSSPKPKANDSPGKFVKKAASTSGTNAETKPKQIVSRKTSGDGRIMRPTVQPPPPPTRFHSYPGTESQSLPCSPPDDSRQSNTSDQPSPYVLSEATIKPSHLLWRPMETKSADNSPVHKPNRLMDEQLRGSTGTLTRNKKGMVAPLPPPRRSSIPVSQSPTSTTPVHGKSNSVDSTPQSVNGVQEKYKALPNINYVNIFEAQKCAQKSTAVAPTPNSTNASSITNTQISRDTVNVDPSVNIQMDKIKAELQKKLSGSDPTSKVKSDVVYGGEESNQTGVPEEFNIKKVKEELQQKLNPSLSQKSSNKDIDSSAKCEQLPEIDQSNYVKPNSQVNKTHEEHFDINKVRNELQQKLAPNSIKKSNKDIPIMAGAVEIEKYKIKPDQHATPSCTYSDGQFDMNKVKAELQQKLAPSSATSSPSKIPKPDNKLISTGSLDSSPTYNSNCVEVESVDGDIQQISSYRSPVVSRRQFSFDFLRQLRENNDPGNMSDTSSDGAVFGGYRTPSPKVGRSNTFTGNAGKQTTPSPKGSPNVTRHSSFSKLAERVPSPLRSLFGGDRERTSSESDATSAPPSPRRIPSVANNTSPLTKTAALNRSLSNGNAQSNGKNGKKKVPVTVVRPFSSTSDSEVTTPLHKEIIDSMNSDQRYSTFSTFKRHSTPGPSGDKTRDHNNRSRISPLAIQSHPRSSDVTQQLALEAVSKRRSASQEDDRGQGIGLQSSSVSHMATLPRGRRCSDSSSTSPTTPTFTTFGSPKASPKCLSRCKNADDVAKKKYVGENIFREANADVEMLIKSVEITLSEVNRRNFKVASDIDLKTSKDQLVAESRQFVTDSKLLVSSATQSLEKLIENVNSSIHTLAKIVKNCQGTMKSMTSLPAAQNLGSKVKDVAIAYKTTVNAAHVAAGKPLSDPQMKLLMRQATTLASILSTLMKTLKLLENG